MSTRKLWAFVILSVLFFIIVADFVQDYKVYRYAQKVEQETQQQIERILREQFSFLQFLMDGCHPQAALGFDSQNSFFMVAKSLARKKLGSDASNLHFFLVTRENNFLYPADMSEDIRSFGKTISLSSYQNQEEILYVNDRYVAAVFPVIRVIFNPSKLKEEFVGYLVGVRSKEKIISAIDSYYQNRQGPRFLPVELRVNFKCNELISLRDLQNGVALEFIDHSYEFLLLPIMRLFLLGMLLASIFIWKYFTCK